MALNDDNRTGAPGNADRDPGLDRLYRAAGGEHPPAHLDAAILAAAHREAGARPQSRPTALRRWHVPVSIAAVVVLSVTLVTLVNEEGGEPLMQASPPPAPAEPPGAQPVRPVPALPEAERVRPPAAASATVRPAPRGEIHAEAPVALGKMADSAAGGVAPVPLQEQGAGAASAPDAAARSQPQPFRDVPVPAERYAAAPRAASAEDVGARAKAAAGRGVAPMAAAPAPESARAGAMAQARKEAVADSGKVPVWQGFESEPPQKWLERIAELKRQERAAEAEGMLAEFKRRFPSHPLPPGLQ